ncbi:MAG: hypothetical protein UR26_C0002G0126 [candidate division TM6 bacterium GW2011_GWF2_32_72]|nr:MAG: hypothetical protein UR26_C0002G0126 [candidate division TM6 bacterium GW2011_GWF2_32_72]
MNLNLSIQKQITLIILLVSFLWFEKNIFYSIDEHQIPPEKNYPEQIKILPSGTKYLVNPSHITSDINVLSKTKQKEIHALFNPNFETIESANNWLNDNDIIFGVEQKNESKAYPQKIIQHHYVVNDNINKKPITLTYSPATKTIVLFSPKIDNQILEFNATLKNYNKVLIIKDTLTESLWTQIDGKAIVGDFSGKTLKAKAVQSMLWKDWKRLHPNTKVLSKNTGFKIMYESTKDEFKFQPNTQPKLIAGVFVDGENKAYSLNHIKKTKIINDEINKEAILIVQDPSIELNEKENINPTAIFKRYVGNGETLTFKIQDNTLIDIQTETIWNFEGKAVEGFYKGKQLKKLANKNTTWSIWKKVFPKTLFC